MCGNTSVKNSESDDDFYLSMTNEHYLPKTLRIKEIFADYENEVSLIERYVEIWVSVSSLFYVIWAIAHSQINLGLFLVGSVIILVYHTLCKWLINSARELIVKVCYQILR